MLDQILNYMTDNGISGYERVLAALLPVICFSTTTYMLFSFAARNLVQSRKGGILRFSAFCLLKMIAAAALVIPWVAFLYLTTHIALNP